VNKEETILSK
jgi:hypothetical protein